MILVLYLICGIRNLWLGLSKPPGSPEVQSRLSSNVLGRARISGSPLWPAHTVPAPPPSRLQLSPTLARSPELTQDTVEAKLLIACTAVCHIPGLGDLHSQVLGPVHGLGTLSPRYPSSTIHIGRMGSLHLLQLLDPSGHWVAAQLVTQQREAIFYKGERMP